MEQQACRYLPGGATGTTTSAGHVMTGAAVSTTCMGCVWQSMHEHTDSCEHLSVVHAAQAAHISTCATMGMQASHMWKVEGAQTPFPLPAP